MNARPEFFIWCYPWDLEDERAGPLPERVAADTGVDALSVATTYHSVRHFRPHAGAAPDVFSSEAAAHFQPSAACYRGSRIRPLTAAWIRNRNPLARIGEACRRAGLGLRAWTVVCHGSALAARYPDAACCDVFGARSSSWLCPANPDVREYAAGLVEDLSTNYPLSVIELEAADFGSGTHAHAHLKRGLDVGPLEEWLLSLCFCAACRQAAERRDVDAAAVERSVRAHLEPALSGRPASLTSPTELIGRDPLLAAYQAVRSATVVELVETARRRSRVPLIIHSAWSPLLAAWDPAMMAPHSGGMLLPAWIESEPDRQRRLRDLGAAVGSPADVQLGFFGYPPAMPSADELVRRVHAAVTLGHVRIGFYNYGIAPQACLDWVRQAVRFARREVGV